MGGVFELPVVSQADSHWKQDAEQPSLVVEGDDAKQDFAQPSLVVDAEQQSGQQSLVVGAEATKRESVQASLVMEGDDAKQELGRSSLVVEGEALEVSDTMRSSRAGWGFFQFFLCEDGLFPWPTTPCVAEPPTTTTTTTPP